MGPANGASNGHVHQTQNSRSVEPVTVAQKPVRSGILIPSAVRDALISRIARHGREHFVQDIRRLAPDRSRNSAKAIVRELQKSPHKRWATTTHALLVRLAQYYQNPQSELPIPREEPVAKPQQAVPQRAIVQPQHQAPQQFDVQQIATAVAVAIAGVFGQQQQAPQLAPMQPAELTPEPGIKDFPELSVPMQRAVLNSMHDRYAQLLERQGVTDRTYAEAWKQSYAAFYKATGINIDAMASEESDREGRRVRPLDIIERAGWLVRFWEVCRKAWG